jgi:hypothetical protein
MRSIARDVAVGALSIVLATMVLGGTRFAIQVYQRRRAITAQATP